MMELEHKELVHLAERRI